MRTTRNPITFYLGIAQTLTGHTLVVLGDKGVEAPAGIKVVVMASQNGRILLKSNKYGYVWAEWRDLVPEEDGIYRSAPDYNPPDPKPAKPSKKEKKAKPARLSVRIE